MAVARPLRANRAVCGGFVNTRHGHGRDRDRDGPAWHCVSARCPGSLVTRGEIKGVRCGARDASRIAKHCGAQKAGSLGARGFRGGALKSMRVCSSSLDKSESLVSQKRPQVGEGRPRVKHIPNLTSDELRHPLDKQNTQLVALFPGIEGIVKSMLSPISEQIALIENIGTSVLVGEEQLPEIHRLLREAASILQVEVPELYIRQDPVPNAYTLAIKGRKPFVVMHTSLVELLEPDELQAVLAHELGHLKCDHGVWLTIANLLALGAISLLPIISSTVQENFLRWLRSAELTCDRAALIVVQDHKTVVSMLMKLAGGSASLSPRLNVEAFIKQARSYDEATSSPLGWYLRNAHVSQLTHPLPVMRAKEIEEWAMSLEFKNILKRGRKYGLPEEV